MRATIISRNDNRVSNREVCGRNSCLVGERSVGSKVLLEARLFPPHGCRLRLQTLGGNLISGIGRELDEAGKSALEEMQCAE